SLKGKMDVIYFIIGMNIITVVLAEGGLFDYLAKKITLLTRGHSWKVFLLFCLMTYFLSLAINNLTTMLVLTPMILSLSRYLKFDIRVYLIGMIVASNLGGASTLVGDFPNMLIGTETGIPFLKFVKYMMPICFIEFLILIIYIRVSQKGSFSDLGVTPKNKSLESGAVDQALQPSLNGLTSKTKFFGRLEQDLKSGLKNTRVVRRGLFILGLLLVGFVVADWIPLPDFLTGGELRIVPPAWLALIGGGLALFLAGLKPGRVLRKLNYRDIFFFTGLFVLVGAAEAGGLLSWCGEIIVHLSFGNTLVRCLLLMWVAALMTAFLNAGPATALFLPLVVSFNAPAPHHLYWWSLSLGVLAGSSATLTGATAGSIVSTLLRKFTPGKINNLSFRAYARLGVPLALIFLLVSSVYVTFIYHYG
ncbi:MAG: hypothetical protein KAI63_00440, partial [Planctomycetes bacterium]|nr:hypothetical protein [Planctomycetota bacterium]